MTEPQGAPAPAPAALPAVAPVPPTSPKVVTADDLPPEALRQRLEQAKHAERTAVLAELGIGNVEEAKTAIAAQKAATEAARTDAEKLAALNLRVTAQAEALTVAVSQAAARITPEQKAAVDAIAGQDSAIWLKTYAALAPTWASSTAPAAPAPAPGAAPVAAPIVQPTSTAPAAPAPASGAPTSPPDHSTIYGSLKKTNPFAASQYLQRHGDACYPKT